MISKLHEKQEKKVLAACDKDLVGKKFEDEKTQIEVKEDFYGTEKIEKEEFIEKLHEADMANLVGEKTIEIAVDEGLADPEQTLEIDGIPHAQIIKIKKQRR